MPPFATFWFLSTFDTNSWYSFGPPLPYNPFSDRTNVPIYRWEARGNSYVVDDTVLPPQQQEQYFRDNPPETELMASGQSFSQDDASGDGSGGDSSPMFAYPSNYLWLSIESVSNGTAYITAHGTVSNQTYELMSRMQLTDTNWISEGTFIGNQDWTPTTIAVGARTNQLFISARSWADDGSGLPIWWQLQYFGYTGVDPYDDPD